MTDVTADYLALRREAGVVELPRDILHVHGPDAAAFLQGQLSQDIAPLAVGASTWSFVLQPQGKVDGFVRVTRVADDRFVLDTDAGWGEPTIARLERFKLRTKAEVDALDWRCVAVRGPRAHDLAPSPPAPEGEWIAAAADWPGLPGIDLLGPSAAVDDALAASAAAEVRRCSLDAFESVRIEAGIPVLGRELTERTIPQEAGVVDRAVSFTKGCYTGQELVARIDSRGHVNRHLRGVVMETNVLPPPTATVVVDGKEVGELTSVGESLDRRAPVALAHVRREVEPPAPVTVVWDGGEARARVEALPLVGGPGDGGGR